VLPVACDAFLDLRHAPLHLGPGEVLAAVVHRLELADFNRDAGLREQPQSAADRNKPSAHLADGAAVVLAEVGNRLWSGASRPVLKPGHRIARQEAARQDGA
jgi:hypothetical protein